jgi:hypothetical protein
MESDETTHVGNGSVATQSGDAEQDSSASTGTPSTASSEPAEGARETDSEIKGADTSRDPDGPGTTEVTPRPLGSDDSSGGGKGKLIAGAAAALVALVVLRRWRRGRQVSRVERQRQAAAASLSAAASKVGQAASKAGEASKQAGAKASQLGDKVSQLSTTAVHDASDWAGELVSLVRDLAEHANQLKGKELNRKQLSKQAHELTERFGSLRDRAVELGEHLQKVRA